MKKSLIGTLALGLIIGTGALTVKSFANERTVLNQETNQFEQIDDSNYRNSNPNYGQGCPHMDYGNFGN